MRPASIFARPWLPFVLLGGILALLALARPIDHDESQYVAAAVLAQHGLPYRDFAYLQTPLQPILFAPLAAVFGTWTWPGLRVVNALLGTLALAFIWRAARASGANERTSAAAAALFATCDIMLFSIGTARNDALPAALFAAALLPVMRAAKGDATPASAALAGVLLAAAAAAKISYAVPALAYGIYALADRRHRPLWVASGVLPMAALIGWTFLAAPQGFMFGVFDFPARAPAEYYAALGRTWKLSYAAKTIDTLKFLALGPALLALTIVVRDRRRDAPRRVLDLLIVAALIAALLPFPTWRQYLLPVLPPLFVRLAMTWTARPPGPRLRVATIVFACAGLAPSIVSLAAGIPAIAEAMRQGAAIRVALDRAQVTGPIATLSPQFLPAAGRRSDPRFATGPFYFRSQGLFDASAESATRLISKDTLAWHFAQPPAAILVGGEGRWTSGDPALDNRLEAWARAARWRRIVIAGGRFLLYVPRQAGR